MSSEMFGVGSCIIKPRAGKGDCVLNMTRVIISQAIESQS
jgi:hypothetical protein